MDELFWYDRETKRGRGDDAGQQMVMAARLAERHPDVQDDFAWALKNAQMYEASYIRSLNEYGGRAQALESFRAAGVDGVTWNVFRSVVDTLCAQVSQTRVRPRAITNHGRWKGKRNARKMTQLCDGLFNETNFYEEGQAVFRDGCLFRQGGGLHVFERGSRVTIERVLPGEVFCDPDDAKYGKPQTLYRRRNVDRAVLLSQWGKTAAQKAAIKAAIPADGRGNDSKGSDKIQVLEAWHLPTIAGKDGTKDGRHMVAIESATGDDGGTLCDEAWTRSTFPIPMFRYSDGFGGAGGQTLGDMLRPMQVKINKRLKKIDKVLSRVCVPYVSVPRGSKVTPSQLEGDIGHRIDYTGNVGPRFDTPGGLPAEEYAHLEREIEKMFSLPGVSRDFARGTKEQSLTAAVAIQESLKIQDNRMALLQQRWERFAVTVAKEMIAVSRDIYGRAQEEAKDVKGKKKAEAKAKGYRVTAPGTRFLETVDWSEIDFDEDMYEIVVKAASLLPTEPGERKQMVIELVEKGVWSPERGEAALDDLDPDDNQDLESAATRDLERMLDDMLYEAKYDGPEPWMDLQLALKTAVQYMHMGRDEKAPGRNLKLINKFMEEVKALQKKLTPPPAPAAPAPALPPIVGPAPLDGPPVPPLPPAAPPMPIAA